MKRILIIVCLLFTANSWAADEEFPIELTCELGHLILYYNITDNPDTTWWQYHSSNLDNISFFNYERHGNVKENKNRNQWKGINDRKRIKVNKDNIYIHFKLERMVKMQININRVTGGASFFHNVNSDTTHDGHCTKGFKNYEKNVF